jgi:15-cis-phytoene desaturase
MALHVIVIGGGVAGLTAAHELSDRGVAVTVYERRPDWGGKARSQPVPGSAIGGRKPLPGEHGFRFYPRFYKHVIDLMQRIPVGGSRSVADYLKPTTESAVALVDNDTWYRFFRRPPDRPLEILEALELFFKTLDFDAADLSLFGAKIMQFFTSCEARRFGRYEHQSWWQFLQGDDYSRKFQRQLRAVPRTMVAMDPKRGSARTIGAISTQLILDYASTGVTNDRTMGGPTSEMWIDPWIAHLQSRGVQLHPDVAVDGLNVEAGRISGVRLTGDVVPKVADFYVLAVPVDQAIAMITPQMGELDPTLETLRTSNANDLVSWMVGAQYFLKEDVALVRGHTFYPDAPWALTSISQAQFWTDGGLFRERYGDGAVGGVLSVDISDWDTPGIYVRKPAKQCTPAEIRQEIWEELKAALNGHQPGDVVLRDALVHSFHLDADLDYAAGTPPTNHSRLLIHPPGSWAIRPEAATQIPNLVLAGDYVRTNTDLASMEGACEAARRAVNAILQRSGSSDTPATIWALTEPEQFEPWKHLDARLYAADKSHVFELLGIRHAGAAAGLLRRFNEVSGIAALDDHVDELRATEIIKSVRTRLGL